MSGCCVCSVELAQFHSTVAEPPAAFVFDDPIGKMHEVQKTCS